MTREYNQPDPIEHHELALRQRLADVGMSDQDRLHLLSQGVAHRPPRQIHAGDRVDPFGLLEQDDTYEAIATKIFDQCEGIYKQVVNANPSVAKQVKRALPGAAIKLPTTTLTDLYSYEITRTADDSSTSYLFHRTDKGYEDNGFRVVKGSDDHTVLKNIDPDSTDLSNDEQYYSLLYTAQRWIEDYAVSLNIAPKSLREFAKQELRPYGMQAKLRSLGSCALDKLLKVTTVKTRRGGRRPRFAAVAVAAALAPIPGMGLAGVVAAESAGSAIGGIFAADHSKELAIKRFDHLGLQLPSSADIPLGARNAPVAYDGTLNLTIQNNAPNAGKTTLPGKVRAVDPSWNWKDGYNGLPHDKTNENNCNWVYTKLPNANSIRVVTTNPDTAGALTVTTSNNALFFCNVSNHDLYQDDGLQNIFIEPEN